MSDEKKPPRLAQIVKRIVDRAVIHSNGHTVDPSQGELVLAEYLDAREARLRGALQKLSRQVEMHHHSDMGRSFYPDHACGKCVPGGEMVREGFLCGRHEALAVLDGAGPDYVHPDTVNALVAMLGALQTRHTAAWSVLEDALQVSNGRLHPALGPLLDAVGLKRPPAVVRLWDLLEELRRRGISVEQEYGSDPKDPLVKRLRITVEIDERDLREEPAPKKAKVVPAWDARVVVAEESTFGSSSAQPPGNAGRGQTLVAQVIEQHMQAVENAAVELMDGLPFTAGAIERTELGSPPPGVLRQTTLQRAGRRLRIETSIGNGNITTRSYVPPEPMVLTGVRPD